MFNPHASSTHTQPVNWVIGNWKMNGDVRSNAALLHDIASISGTAKMAVCVPYPYLAQAQAALKDSSVVLGAQDLSPFEKGAFTGEVSANMLKDFGVALVLVGHSERRSLLGETDELVAAKAQAALAAGLTPVICMGETSQERTNNQAQAVVLRQFNAVFDLIGAQGLAQSILAYEPVWAIGTGLTATPEEVQEVHGWLREALYQVGVPDVSILYGGSVKANNAAGIFNQRDVNGGLIGGASLVADEFLGIYHAI